MKFILVEKEYKKRKLESKIDDIEKRTREESSSQSRSLAYDKKSLRKRQVNSGNGFDHNVAHYSKNSQSKESSTQDSPDIKRKKEEDKALKRSEDRDQRKVDFEQVPFAMCSHVFITEW